MIAGAQWIGLAVLLAGGLAVLLLSLFSRNRSGLAPVERTFRCPHQGRDVRLVAVRDEVTGQFTAVRSCDAVTDRDGFGCTRRCLVHLNEQR